MFGRKKRSLSDFDEEIQAHIDIEAEEFRKDGLDETETRYAAQRKFGNVTIAKERFYEFGRWLWLDTVIRNLGFAWRITRRRPLSALSIIALLALGTGGVTAVFNPTYSTFFASLPFPRSEQLVLIGGDIPLFNTEFSRFERREELDRLFSNMTAYATVPSYRVRIFLEGKSKSKAVHATYITEDFFETLGVKPIQGSGFSRDFRSFIISNRFWREELNSAEDVIGRTMWEEDRVAYPIIGIMPESFDFPAGTDVWVCHGNGHFFISNDTLQFLGRMRPGMSMGKVAEDLKAMNFKPGDGLRKNPGPLLRSLKTFLYGDRRPMLWMLGSAAVLFLLLVCAGVMNLLVTQGARRKSEMALRQVMGATRRNLIFQLLCETLPLVVAGALAGLWIYEAASAWLMVHFPALKGGEVVVPAKMAFFAALVFAVTIISGLIPALYTSGVNLNEYLKSGTNFKRRFFSLSLRELLVGIQLSLALALLTGIGLLVSSMMFHVDIPIRWSSRDMVVVRAAFNREYASLRNVFSGITESFKHNAGGRRIGDFQTDTVFRGRAARQPESFACI